MQRKNSILRNGMAMIMAIFVIVIISTILALSLRLSSQGVQRTTDLYLYEQATILSRSATEYAMSVLSKVNPCSLNSIPSFRYNNTYDINISTNYIPFNGSDCDTNATAIGAVFANTTTEESDGTVIIDVTVTGNPAGTTEPIKYFRRTIQKL
ncbi:hypothetical protein [Sulfurimonas sp. C5]|uniref:hypothetical protein n=1 Tax=Sulfurimonas sp. C5 TaxID=3036947 RepID=UPI00245807FE|nr:hypothetical protein [Sulfurimonas sp. C5]MDH4944561.1 hypothetical protein [Sulfurimonas sp. C5]